MSPADLQKWSEKSRVVLLAMGPEMRWVESFVTSDKLYCVFMAPNEAAIREHAQRGGFPANRFSAVTEMIDPTTAESRETKKAAGYAACWPATGRREAPMRDFRRWPD